MKHQQHIQVQHTRDKIHKRQDTQEIRHTKNKTHKRQDTQLAIYSHTAVFKQRTQYIQYTKPEKENQHTPKNKK